MAVSERTAAKGKGRIRSLNRKGTASGKAVAVVAKTGTPDAHAVCERCGAVYARKTWRQGRKVTHGMLGEARWTVCPSCKQVESGEYFGRVVLRGAYVNAFEEDIRQRIQNVATRAQTTQPQRRLVAVGRDGAELEVLTTSQKLAHRIVNELKKAFRGRATYDWSDRDGALYATWERDDVPGEKKPARRW